VLISSALTGVYPGGYDVATQQCDQIFSAVITKLFFKFWNPLPFSEDTSRRINSWQPYFGIHQQDCGLSRSYWWAREVKISILRKYRKLIGAYRWFFQSFFFDNSSESTCLLTTPISFYFNFDFVDSTAVEMAVKPPRTISFFSRLLL
jgi:hypothetical protein